MTKKAGGRWAVLLLIAYAVLSIGSASQESLTYDEPIHILSGLAAWTTSTITLDKSNPPLAYYWQTLPLLWMRHRPFPPPEILSEHRRSYSYGFVHHNRYPAAWLFQPPRMMTTLIGIFLGVILFLWAGEALGGPAAVGTLAAYSFCPILLAYGSLATTDMACALAWTLVFFLMWRWRQNPTLSRAFGLGTAFGAALCFKYSSAPAIPAAFGAIVIAGGLSHAPFTARRRTLILSALLAFLGMNLVLMLCFRGWGFPEWMKSFQNIVTEFKEGHANYFWGAYGTSGWKSYFVAAFLLKTPLPFLAALIGGGMLYRQWPPQKRHFLLSWSLWPVALLLVVSSFSTIQVGIRHILPIYPFLCLWVGATMAKMAETKNRLIQRLAVLLSAWYIVGTVFAFPRYLSYFNETIGRASEGYHYFADSNLDWGQGLKSLGDYLRREGSPPIYLSYFGCTDPSLYGIHFKPILMVTCADVGPGEEIPEGQSPLYFAISATNRVGLYYTPHNAFAWLDERKPVKVLMDSIWLYDITNDPDAKARLQALRASSPLPATPSEREGLQT